MNNTLKWEEFTGQWIPVRFPDNAPEDIDYRLNFNVYCVLREAIDNYLSSAYYKRAMDKLNAGIDILDIDFMNTSWGEAQAFLDTHFINHIVLDKNNNTYRFIDFTKGSDLFMCALEVDDIL